jgi:hypothetical protein
MQEGQYYSTSIAAPRSICVIRYQYTNSIILVSVSVLVSVSGLVLVLVVYNSMLIPLSMLVYQYISTRRDMPPNPNMLSLPPARPGVPYIVMGQLQY